MGRSIGAILQDIRSFEPVDGNWLGLDDLLGELWSQRVPADVIPTLFGVFERYPDEDGAGVFWSIVHGVESMDTQYEDQLRESLARQQSEMATVMLRRLQRAKGL